MRAPLLLPSEKMKNKTKSVVGSLQSYHKYPNIFKGDGDGGEARRAEEIRCELNIRKLTNKTQTHVTSPILEASGSFFILISP